MRAGSGTEVVRTTHPRTALLVVLALAVLLMSAVVAPAPAQAAIVDGASLQAAINAASPGDTITIPAGTFTGSLRISGKSGLTLQGQGRSTILQAPGSDEVLGIYSSSSITLRDFAIKGDYTVLGQRGIGVFGCAGLTAADLTITDCGFSGFYSNGALTDALLSRVNVTHCGDFGIHVQAAATGIVDRIVIEDCVTAGFASRQYPGHGIYTKRAANVTIRRCDASGVAKLMGNGSGGYQITESTNVLIEDSSAHDNIESGFIINGCGAALYRSTGARNPGGDFYECDSAGFPITYVDCTGTNRVWPTAPATTTTTVAPTTTTTTAPPTTTTTTAAPTTTVVVPMVALTTTTTMPPTTTTTVPVAIVPTPSPLMTATFLSPALNSVVRSRVQVTASVIAQARVSSVTFYIDGVKKCIDSRASYGFTWDTRTYTTGAHVLKAVALDRYGRSVTTQMTVYVTR